MFVTSGGRPALLQPENYWDSDLFQEEQSAIKSNAWFFAALISDLSQEGSYVSRSVAGVPIIVWKAEGSIRAFKNICPHRHCKVVKDGPGVGSSIQCQYHGWEFSCSGKLKYVPDAIHFKGCNLSQRKLEELGVDLLGDFVLISFNPNLPTQRTILGPLCDEIDPFYKDQKLFFRQTVVLPVNWKLILENAAENYHVPKVHPGFFKVYFQEELSDHRLHAGYSRFLDLRPWKKRGLGALYKFCSWAILGDFNPKRFTVVHIFPHFMLYYGSLFSVFTSIEPIKADLTRIHSHLYFPKKTKLPLLFAPITWALKIALRRQFLIIFAEDNTVLQEVQHAIRHFKKTAVLSAREERISKFHEYLTHLKKKSEVV